MSSLFTLGTYSQNIIRYSEEFSGASWGSAFVIVGDNVAKAPNGTTTADKLEDAIVTSIASLTTFPTYSIDISLPHTFSMYVKKDDIPRATRFCCVYLRYYGDLIEYGGIKLDTKTGEISTFTYRDTEIVYAAAHSYGDYWHLEFMCKSTNQLNNTMDLFIFPAFGGSPSWNASASVMGSIYAWGASITEGSIVAPYVKTVDTTLEGDGDFIDLDSGFDLKDEHTKIETVRRTLTGDQYRYKWGDYRRFEFPLEYLNDGIKSKINNWWNSNEDVVLTNKITGIQYDVHIVNKSLPIDSVILPYSNQYAGKIILESYL